MSRWEIVKGTLAVSAALAVIGGAIAAVVVVVPHRLPHWLACTRDSAGSPAWSPNGRWIAFAAASPCGTVIAEVHPDGSARHDVTTSFASWPSWSPSGSKILVNTHAGYGVVSAHGGSPRLLIGGASDQGASFSPDGTRIAFTRGRIPFVRDYRATLFEAGRSGAGARMLLGNSCDPGTPSWSPDGRWIAVGCATGLYLVDARSGAAHRILKWDYRALEPPRPAWSPSGRSLAFVDDFNGSLEVVSTDGLHVRRVATLSSDGWPDSASWSPDGRWIAYSASDGGPRDGIYIVRSNGRDNHRIVRLPQI